MYAIDAVNSAAEPAADSTSEAESSGGLQGRIKAKDLLDRLLNFPMDTVYTMSMQEGKSFPVDPEGYRVLYIRNAGALWYSAASSRAASLQLTGWQLDHMESLTQIGQGTVRSLIHRIAALNPEQTIDLGGHFYTEFVIRSYPIPLPKPEPTPEQLAPAVEELGSIPDSKELKAAEKPRSILARIFGAKDRAVKDLQPEFEVYLPGVYDQKTSHSAVKFKGSHGECESYLEENFPGKSSHRQQAAIRSTGELVKC